MFYFELYDDVRLMNTKHSEKIRMVNRAIDLYRETHPVNLRQRLLAFFIWSVLPPIVLFIVIDFNIFIGWIALSTIFLQFKIAAKETPFIKPYLDKVLAQPNDSLT